LTLTGRPQTQKEGAAFGRLTATLSSRGNLEGEWEKDIGSAGTFTHFPHDRPQVSGLSEQTPDQLHTARHHFGAIEIDRKQIIALAEDIQREFMTGQVVVTFVAGIRLILDGTVVRVRLDKKSTSISLLVALGVRQDGQKVLLAVNAARSQIVWRKPATSCSPSRGFRKASGNRSAHPTQLNVYTKSSSGELLVRSQCARSTAGGALPQSHPIRRLTSPHNLITSSCWRSRRNQFQHKLRWHPTGGGIHGGDPSPAQPQSAKKPARSKGVTIKCNVPSRRSLQRLVGDFVGEKVEGLFFSLVAVDGGGIHDGDPSPAQPQSTAGNGISPRIAPYGANGVKSVFNTSARISRDGLIMLIMRRVADL
jgi:hypothetical protein